MHKPWYLCDSATQKEFEEVIHDEDTGEDEEEEEAEMVDIEEVIPDESEKNEFMIPQFDGGDGNGGGKKPYVCIVCLPHFVRGRLH